MVKLVAVAAASAAGATASGSTTLGAPLPIFFCETDVSRLSSLPG
jgi:hypothetical protein